MADNVGQMLQQYLSPLTQGIKAQIASLIENDNFAKDAHIERTKKLVALPPTKFEQFMLFSAPPIPPPPDDTDDAESNDPMNLEPVDVNSIDGNLKYCIIKFNMLVPTFVMVKNVPFEIQKASLKSHFEAMIKKEFMLRNENEVKISGRPGFFGIPRVGFDITNKLTTQSNNTEQSTSTFDISIEMGQGEESFGYIEIVKAFTTCVTQIVQFVTSRSLSNPTPISEDDAKQLNEQADIPISEVGLDQQEAA